MKPNQNTRQNRSVRSNQNNNQKRMGRSQQNNNRNGQSNSSNRQFDSYGPAGHVRGNAKQLYEKYKVLAQDKRASDRIESEALDQYADHYYRMYAETAAAEAVAQVAREKERSRREQEDIERRANAKRDERPLHQEPQEGHGAQTTEKRAASEEAIRSKRLKMQRKPINPAYSEMPVTSDKPQNAADAAPSDVVVASVGSENSAQGENPPMVEKAAVRKPRRKKSIADTSSGSAPKSENTSKDMAINATESSSEA